MLITVKTRSTGRRGHGGHRGCCSDHDPPTDTPSDQDADVFQTNGTASAAEKDTKTKEEKKQAKTKFNQRTTQQGGEICRMKSQWANVDKSSSDSNVAAEDAKNDSDPCFCAASDSVLGHHDGLDSHGNVVSRCLSLARCVQGTSQACVHNQIVLDSRTASHMQQN